MSREDVFWTLVNRRGPTECWEWTGRKHRQGYGLFGKNELAHRAAWGFSRGEIPSGMCVLHHCDNPPCVNPEHLFLGDQSDNAQDREDKGRGHDIRGEANPLAKLTEDSARALMDMMLDGIPARRAARMVGVDKATALRLLHGKTWRHIFGVAA